MSAVLRVIKVFLSFPSDMDSYVSEARKIIAERNSRWERDFQISVRSITFKDLPSGYEERGVLQYIKDNVGAFEIYCGFMGPKFGVPTERFRSGTEEEYIYALSMSGRTVKHVMFGFCEVPANPFTLDADQLAKALEFRKKLDKTQLYFVWGSHADFSTIFEKQMDDVIYKFSSDPRYFVPGGARYS